MEDGGKTIADLFIEESRPDDVYVGDDKSTPQSEDLALEITEGGFGHADIEDHVKNKIKGQTLLEREGFALSEKYVIINSKESQLTGAV
jgi:hypothetical protein